MFGLKKLFGTSTKAPSARRRRQSSRSTVHLALENLEQRCVPSTVASGPDGTTYAIFGGDRELWAQATNGNWSHLIDNVSQVAVSRTGRIDVLGTDNVVRQWVGGWGWIPIIYGNGNIGTIAAGYDAEVYLNWGSSKALYQFDANGHWHDQHTSNVVDIGDMGAAVVYANGALGVNYDGSFHTVVQSGVHHVASGEYNGEILFTWGSDNELWGVGAVGRSYQYFDNHHLNNVAQVSCFANYVSGGLQQFNYVSTNGVVTVDSNIHGLGYVWNGAWTY